MKDPMKELIVYIIATDCPGCGSNGPHDVYIHMGQDVFVCSACGMQHPCPLDEYEDDYDLDDEEPGDPRS